MDMLIRILRLTKPYRKQFIAAILLMLFMLSTRLIFPQFTRIMVDNVIIGGQTQYLYPILIAIFVLTAMRASASYVRAYLFEYTSQSVIYDMRQTLFNHLQEMPWRFYDENRIGEIMSRMTGDVDGVRGFIAGGIPTIMEQIVYFVGSSIILFTLSWQLSLCIFIVYPFIAVIAFKLDRRIRPAFSEIREQNAVLSTRAQENIAGMRVVKAFAREEYEKELFDKENMEHLATNLRVTRLWTNYGPVLDVLANICTVIMIGMGGILTVRGTMTLGTMIAFSGYLWMLSNPMRMIGQIVNILNQAITSGEKLFYYTDLGSSIKEKPDAVFPDVFQGKVAFDHVTFKYGDNTVLRDVSFTVSPGQTLAIMGPTGSGKTSIVNLLGRFYECVDGSVRIDGIDVKEYQMKPLRQQIGYVMQETFLYSESLAQNIAFGHPDMPQEGIAAAAQAAQAIEFIDELPQGYETVVGERGAGLSGGQKQRVAIARALAKQPTILVFDDSTSAVDMETEFAIQEALAAERAHRTTFIIAHRISSVKDADEIIVLDNGRIIERGTHAQLLEHQGWYHEMYMNQYRDYDAIKGGL